ncbi:MAG TPA: carboxypeptidase-like regulatory domain-containing protein [Bryobacteraceae bacterium]|nr:carboxypeptidase-like regulatory domain-containing protein [Bryobacteraceae bacterium]
MKRLLVLVTFGVLKLSAQQMELRSNVTIQRSADEATGTASIEGTVINDVTNAPVKKAQVHLSGPLRHMVSPAVTDATGHFAFTHLDAGSWFVQASHSNFDMNRGLILGDNHKQVTVTADQHVSGVELRLTPMGSISGSLIDEFGDPAAGCQVGAVSMANGANRRPRQQWAANSDDRGEYQIADVPAGRYFVFERCPGALAAPHGFLPRGDPRTPSLAFVPEFYGGTPGLTGATSVLVHPGAEARGIDFRVKTVAASSMEIRLASTQPYDPKSVQVTIRPVDAPMWGFPAFLDFKTGMFRSQPVAPGSYTITADVFNNPRLHGETTVNIGKGAPATAEVDLAAPMSVAGTLHMDTEEQAERGGPLQVMLQPLADWYGSELPQTTVNKDGSFTLPNVVVGRWRLQVMNTQASVRSATFGDREISPGGFDIVPGAAGPLYVVLTSKRMQTAVRVTGVENGTQAQVVAWPKDAEAGDPYQQFSAMVEGGSSVANLSVPPGSYRVYALESTQPWAIAQDPALWAAIADRGKLVEAKDDAGAAEVNVTVDLITRDEVKRALDRALQ